MNSFNHYAYGSIGDWIYKVIGGIKPDENNPGFKHFCIAPEIGGDLEFANTNYESVYGTIGVNWKKSGDKVQLHITVPVNTTATVVLKQAKEVEKSDGLVFAEKVAGFAAEVGSGDYNITFIEK